MEKKKEIVQQIGDLVNGKEDFAEMSAKVKVLKAEFVQLVKEDHENLKKEHEASESEEEFKVPHDEWDGLFADYMADFNQKKKKWDEQKAHELNQNLETKRKIITDLNKLIEEENHIGPAFERFNALKEKWNNTGNVPATDYKDLQRDYSHSIERFFYNINIYKTLKEYDLKKNLQLKAELIKKVKGLKENKSIKDVRDLLASYTKEWDEIGPTQQSEWEKVRDEFWENVREIHHKIGEYYKDQKERLKERLTAKEKLCEKVEEIVQQELSDLKHWNKAQKEINAIREEWRAIGFAGKKHNDEIWNRFKAGIDKFYEHRKEQQEELKEVHKQHEERKLKLIAQADEMKESMDWKNTANAYKKLQSDWKRVGPTHPAREQKLWKKFRASSDHFFARRKDYFDNREGREKENLQKKEAMLKELEALDVKKEKDAMDKLHQFTKDWNGIGFVPKEDKQQIEGSFQKTLNEKLKGLGMDNKEIESQTYELKIEGFKEAENAGQLIQNEYKNLMDKLRKIEADIKQYENNLGFFGGNTDNPLVKQVEEKIETSKKEAGKIKSKIKLLDD